MASCATAPPSQCRHALGHHRYPPFFACSRPSECCTGLRRLGLRKSRAQDIHCLTALTTLTALDIRRTNFQEVRAQRDLHVAPMIV